MDIQFNNQTYKWNINASDLGVFCISIILALDIYIYVYSNSILVIE
jgi:hypothetical protein